MAVFGAVLKQEFSDVNATRGSTAPYTDRFVLEEIAGLLDATAAGTRSYFES